MTDEHKRPAPDTQAVQFYGYIAAHYGNLTLSQSQPNLASP